MGPPGDLGSLRGSEYKILKVGLLFEALWLARHARAGLTEPSPKGSSRHSAPGSVRREFQLFFSISFSIDLL